MMATKSSNPAATVSLATSEINSARSKPINLMLAYYARGSSFYLLARHSDAVADFDASERLANLLARSAEKSGNDEFGATMCVVAATSIRGNLHYLRAAARLALEQPALALNDLDEAVKFKPSEYDYRLARALTHLILGKKREAILDADYLVEQEPGSVTRRVLRGYVKELAGDLSGALLDYRRAIEMDNSSRAAREGFLRVQARLTGRTGPMRQPTPRDRLREIRPPSIQL